MIRVGKERRSLYILARRNYPLTFLEVFDFPIMALNCTRRTHAANPLQSLLMLNSPFAMEQAEYLAARVSGLVGEKAPAREKIETAHWLALSRGPTAQEIKFCEAHLEEQSQLYRELSPQEASQKGAGQFVSGTDRLQRVSVRGLIGSDRTPGTLLSPIPANGAGSLRH